MKHSYLTLLLVLLVHWLVAQMVPPVFYPPDTPLDFRAAETARPLTIDGRLDEAARQSAPLISGFVQQNPVQG